MLRNNKLLLLSLAIIASLAVGFATGWFGRGMFSKPHHGKITRLGQYCFTNPLLACDVGDDKQRDLKLDDFQKKMESLISDLKKQGMAKNISIYFNDLDDDNSININADKAFEAASLIKVPLMMEYFKQAETDPDVLKKEYTYDGAYDWNQEQHYRPKKVLEKGKTYTAEELIHRMIAYSDNNAFRLLLKDRDRYLLNKIHADFGIETISGPAGEKLVSVRSYAIFLRILYNASFLNQGLSEKALLFLSQEDFPQGITSAVPKHIPVASKFGERDTGINGEIKQLHDFGIVYYPGRPYLLCIMTQGADFANLEQVLQQVSKLVFVEFDARLKSVSPIRAR